MELELNLKSLKAKGKKVISICLTIMLILSSMLIPMSVSAIDDFIVEPNGRVTDGNVTDGNVTDGNVTDGNVTDGNVTDGNVTNGNVVGGLVTDGNVTDGNIGYSITWTLNLDTGALKISGNGDMPNWSYWYPRTPWYSYSSKIKSIDIGNEITSIGDYAFYDCNSLTSVTIGNSVTCIGEGAFEYCNSLTSITIPDSVTSIGTYAFDGCYSLTSITIPDSVTSIGDYAFGWCRSLTSITVDEDNSNYSSDEYGVLFNKDKTILIQYPAGNRRNSYTIPDSVTNIGKGAFYNCDVLTSVTIGNSVTNIGDYAFAYCDSLTSVTIGNSVTSIGEGAFENCYSLETIYFNGSEEQWNNIYINSYNECLTNAEIVFCIHDNTTSYKATTATCTENGYTAGVYCNDCESWIEGHEIINADHADENRDGFCDICGNKARSLINIGNCGTNGDNVIWKLYDDGLLVISGEGEMNAYGTSNEFEADPLPPYSQTANDNELGFLYVNDNFIKKIVIEEGVTSIGECAFARLFELESVLIANSVETIGQNAFWKCEKLTAVNIPKGVVEIKSYAFDSCSGLKEVIISDSVYKISHGAFYQCTALENVIIGKGVEDIETCAFYDCIALLNVYYTGNEDDWENIYFGSDNDCLLNANIHFSYVPCPHINTVEFEKTEATCDKPGYTDGVYCEDCGFWIDGHKIIIILHTDDNLDRVCDVCKNEAVLAEGKCGNKGSEIDWKLYFDGELIISGIGDMKDFTDLLCAPWSQYASYITSVVIESGIIRIGDRAFYNCTNLSSFLIADTVTSIGTYALYNTAYYNNASNWENGILYLDNYLIVANYDFDLTDDIYTMKDGITVIADYAFNYCYFKKIVFNNSITHIGRCSFIENVGLWNAHIVIPETVISIDEGAFAWCNLSSVAILNPNCIINGDGHTFGGAETIYGYYNSTAQEFAENVGYMTFILYCPHKNTTSDNGKEATCDEDGYTAGVYCNDCERWFEGHEMIIADHTDANKDGICDKCGESAVDIRTGETISVEIVSDNITYLMFIPEASGIYTFKSNSDEDTYGYLYDADKEQVTSNDDGGSGNNFSITYELQAGVTYYWGARYYSSSKSGFFDVTLVCEEIFCNHENTTSYKATTVTCTENGYTAGVYCNDCETWIEGHETITALGHTYEVGGIVCVVCGETLTLIASDTAGNDINWYLYENGLLKIEGTGEMTNYSYSSAPWYSYRSNITSAYISDGIISIGNYAFYDCDSITSIAIPDSVTNIGDYVFAYCDSLTSVTIGDSVTSIGERAFYDCYNLRSVTIGNSVTNIGDYVFAYCDSLTSITIPDSITSIGDYAFAYCDSLTSVTIPDSVTSIGNSAFEDCDSLTSVTIGNSVTSIGEWAFSDCDSITSIAIPDSVTSIGECAFADCNRLTSITVDENNSNYSSDEYGVLFNKDKTLLVQFLMGNMRTSYTIPKTVTSIGNEAFRYCYTLTNITIPDSVTNIGDFVFYSCNSLTSITIPDSVTSIGEGAFSCCSSLTSITIPDSVTTSIGDYAFSCCYSLTNITIPDSVTSIGIEAFYSCDSLTSITIPDSVTSIGNSAFRYCDSLTSITIPDSVTNIGDYAFEYCNSLTSVTIPNGVTSIGYGAFRGCSGLTDMFIPISVTKIDYNAFKDCSNLTIRCCLNSTAHKYAESNKIPYIIIDRIEISDSASISVNYDKRCIYGIANGSSSFDDLIAPEGCTLSYDKTAERVSTGTKIDVIDSDGYVSSYTAVIFGDTDGDGWYNGMDATIVQCLANGMLTKADVGEAVYMAADCNHDGVIDSSDVALLNQAGLLFTNIDQTKSEQELATNSEYIEYLELIDQTPDSDNNTSADESEAVIFTDFTSLLAYIFEIIKKLLSMIFTAVL